ncbi:hypothetical protein Tco_0488549 [Tanacetum coccineum]
MREAVDAGLVVTESSGTKPDKQDTSSSSGNYTTQAVDADIGPVNDEEPFAEVQLTALHNILANEQQHTEQSEPNYDTHLLETIDSNTTPTSTNMCHRGGEIDQDALLNAELLKTKDMVCMEVYNELSKRFLQLEKHCISLEISIQQKEESFHSNKPCKNKEYPEFREFFVINDLKAQLQAKTTLICDLKNQIKSVKEASNEAKVKNDIDVIETINIELEHSVAKLLAANEQLHKENEHLKQTYKELYDSIKKTRIQNKDNSESLISQINQKSVENADLKAQIQEKVFANAALKNELRKLKGNSVETKFAKASILGKPPLQPSRNHLVVRQPNAFTSERPRISRPRFASKVDEKNDLSKIVTPHYLPKVRESAPAKPHHVNAPSSSRNSQKESYGSNDMAHTYFLEEDRKKTEERNMIPIPRDLASARTHRTPNACIPNPRNISRCLHVSKSSCVPSNVVPLVDHSRNSSFFSDSKHFVCSTCQKCVFNENHDDCITKFLKEVNSRAMVKSHKTRNNNKPVEPKSHTQKPGRQIVIGQMFSLNKSSAMHEKPHTPRSCLRWKPTGRIFKTVGLRWIPTGKMFTDSTTNVDSEPLNGSNDDIANPYECDQTLYFSAGLVLHQMTLDHSSSSLGPHCLMTSVHISSGLVLHQMTLDHSSSRLGPHCLMTFEQNSSGLVLHQMTFEQIGSSLVLQSLMSFDHISSSLVPQCQMASAGISSGPIRWQKRIFLHLNLQEEMNRSFIARSGYRLERETFSWIYRSCRRILSSIFQLIFRILVALAGPYPEHMHDVFLATNYRKNLEDNVTFGDQVINDKSQEDELGKTTVESEVESMVIVPIQQASSSAPPLNSPVIDLSSLSQNQYLLPVKNHSLQLPPPTPALQQSRTDLEMVKS